VQIATWNVNSVRFRLKLVSRLLRDEQPDVICLQETKVLNELFPAAAFHKLGQWRGAAQFLCPRRR
jgi:exodeoxyribonuclease-3